MTMLREALAAAAAGLPVFPCHPNDKQPLVQAAVKGEGGVKLATTDAEQIKKWWIRWPNAMIGMRCGTRESGGAGVFVLDIDPKYGESADSVLKRFTMHLAQLKASAEGLSGSVREFELSVEAALAYALPATPIAVTPRGGLHLWFLAPDGLDIGNRVNVLKGKIEQIDTRGASHDSETGEFKPGYVILPPSMRTGPRAILEGSDGKLYEWRVPFGSLARVAEAPAELVHLVVDRQRATVAPGRTWTPSEAMPSADNSDARQAAIRKMVQAALDGELERARSRKGSRNNDLNAAALSLGKLIPGGHLDESAVRGLLLQEAQNNGLVADDGMHTVLATIDSGIEAGKRNPRSLDEVGRLAGRGKTRPPPATAADFIPSSSGYQSFSDLSPQPRADQEAIEPADYHAEASAGDDGPPKPPPIGEGDGGGDDEIDPEKLELASLEKQNDTGNARRLLIWHGDNFLNVDVTSQLGGSQGLHVWSGKHWEVEQAGHAVMLMAQTVWPLIILEADLLPPSEAEQLRFDAGSQATADIERLKPELLAAADDKVKRDELARELARLKGIEAAGMEARASLGARRGARRKFGLSSGNDARLGAMVRQAVPHRTFAPAAMDADPLSINCENGTLRIVRGGKDANGRGRYSIELTEHERTDKITKLMPVDYDPAATAPKFLEFIERQQPKTENLAFLQTWHGLALTGLTEQAFVLNYGTGANGKTTFIETLARLQGGYAETLPAEALVGDGQRRGDQATPELARLAGARLVRCAELPRGQGFRESVLKLLTGGDSVPVRQLHGRFWNLKPQFKAVGFCNEKPDISGVDEGIWRRVKLVNWDIAIPPDKRRPIDDVLEEFDLERAGILNWLLAGLMLYLEAGRLIVPKDVLDATESYRIDMDPVGSFVDSCVTKERKGCTVSARDMYLAYQAFCHTNSLRVMSQKNFGLILATKKIEKKRGAVILYINVELHDVPADPHPEREGQWAGRRPRYEAEPIGPVRAIDETAWPTE